MHSHFQWKKHKEHKPKLLQVKFWQQIHSLRILEDK